jgi:hypothetical protein
MRRRDYQQGRGFDEEVDGREKQNPILQPSIFHPLRADTQVFSFAGRYACPGPAGNSVSQKLRPPHAGGSSPCLEEMSNEDPRPGTSPSPPPPEAVKGKVRVSVLDGAVEHCAIGPEVSCLTAAARFR